MELVRQGRGHQSAVNAVRYSSDGNYCMSCGEDRTLRLWNPVKEDPASISQPGNMLSITVYSGAHGHGVLDVCIARDNSRFASCGGDRAAFLWDVASGRVVRKFQGHSHRINAVAMNVDSTVLATASYDKSLSLWDLRANGREAIQTFTDFRDSVSSVICTDSCIIAGSVDGSLRTFDLRSGLTHCDSLGDQQPITHVSISNDGRSVLSVCMGGRLLLTDIATGKLLNIYSGHRQENYKVEARILSDDRHLICGSEDGNIIMWDLVSARLRCSTRAHGKCVASIASHPSSPQLLSAAADGLIKLWDFSASSATCS